MFLFHLLTPGGFSQVHPTHLTNKTHFIPQRTRWSSEESKQFSKWILLWGPEEFSQSERSGQIQLCTPSARHRRLHPVSNIKLNTWKFETIRITKKFLKVSIIILQKVSSDTLCGRKRRVQSGVQWSVPGVQGASLWYHCHPQQVQRAGRRHGATPQTREKPGGETEFNSKIILV